MRVCVHGERRRQGEEEGRGEEKKEEGEKKNGEVRLSIAWALEL